MKEIQEIIGDATGYKVSDRRAGWFQAYLAKKGPCLYELMNSDVAQLGQLLANHIAVGWAGNVHTADYVPVAAVGPGAERFEGFIQNVDVFRHYTQLAGIDFKNPEGAFDRRERPRGRGRGEPGGVRLGLIWFGWGRPARSFCLKPWCACDRRFVVKSRR